VATNHVLRIDAPSSAWLIDAIDAFVGAVAASGGLGADAAQDVQIAVHEAVMNAVMHGSGRGSARRFILEVSLDPEALEVSVRDEGQGFDPCAVPDPLVEPNLGTNCGRGIFLMRALMDEVAFLPNAGGGTHVRMLKRRARSHCEAPAS
jgi:serine/threonine-protein kinase RsbW